MGVGGLSDRVGQGGNLGDDLSDSKSLSGGVGKVASQPVVLDGSGVMGGCPDQGGGSVAGEPDLAGDLGPGGGDGHKGGEGQEGLQEILFTVLNSCTMHMLEVLSKKSGKV